MLGTVGGSASDMKPSRSMAERAATSMPGASRREYSPLVNASVTLGVAIPQTFIHEPVDAGRIKEFLRHAEALGFASAWVVEQILGSAPSLESVTLLAYAAAVTERLRLGSAVLLTALRAILAERGRAAFPIGKRVYVALDRDRSRAGKRLAEWFGAFYGKPALAEDVSVFGDADACVEGLRAVVAAGAGFLMLNPVFDELDQLERLAADVAPRL